MRFSPRRTCGSLSLTRNGSVAFGARFLKRVIDERIKIPITIRWNDGSHFRVRVAQREMQVEATRPHCKQESLSGAA